MKKIKIKIILKLEKKMIFLYAILIKIKYHLKEKQQILRKLNYILIIQILIVEIYALEDVLLKINLKNGLILKFML